MIPDSGLLFWATQYIYIYVCVCVCVCVLCLCVSGAQNGCHGNAGCL